MLFDVIADAAHPGEFMRGHGAFFDSGERMFGLRQVGGSGDGEVYGGVGEDKAVAIARGGGWFPGRGSFGRHQLRPGGSGVADHSWRVGWRESGENFGFGTAVGGVIAEVENVDLLLSSHLAEELAIVGGGGDEANAALLFEAVAGVEHALRNGLIPVAQEEYIGVVVTDAAEGFVEADGDVAGDGDELLDDENHLLAAGLEIAEGLAEAVTADAAPIEVVHAVIECGFDGRGGHAIAGGKAEGANLEAGAAEDACSKGGHEGFVTILADASRLH